jgi:uncharacterized protein
MPQKRSLPCGVLNTALLHADVARGRFSFDSSRYLNHCSNVLTIIRNIGRPNKAGEGALGQGDFTMARFEILDSTAAPLGEGPAAGDVLFELGMMYSVGRDVPIDLVSAHKWFNLAAVRGNREAARLRREIADQMSESEIAAAQRAARDWLKATAAAPASAPAAALAA